MTSFKPGWLYGSNLDNARAVFACIIVGVWAVFDDTYDDVIPVSVVCSTGVLGLWNLVWSGVGGSGTALRIESGISSFLRN